VLPTDGGNAVSNSLADLNAHLFAQLERLDVEAMSPEQIEAEVERSKAIVSVADRITENAKVQLNAARLYAEHRDAILPMLPQLGKAKE
jgi:ribosomal protein L17